MKFTERSDLEAGFTAVFDAEVRPRLAELEEKRLALLAKAKRNVALVGAGTLVLILLIVIAMGPDKGIGFGFALLMFGVLGAVVVWSMAGSGWKSSVEEAIMPAVCKHVGDLSYDPVGSAFDVGTMRSLRLLPSSSKTTLKSRLSGTHHGTGFEMVHATLTTSSSGSNNNKSTKTVFKGLLFRINVPQPAPGKIVLMRDYGSFGNKLAETFSFGSTRSMPKVDFDHAEFEAAFEVYADRPEEAKAFMPNGFLDALLKIGDDQGQSRGAQAFVAGFEGSSFYIALRRQGDFMQMGGLTKPATDIENDLHGIFDDIALSHQIIDRLHGV